MLSIRAAEPGDIAMLLDMLHASSADQGFADEVAVTAADLLEDGFGPNPRFQAIVAEHGGVPAGMALFFINYSTWVSRLGVYLEDLYVKPEFRRRSIGRALLTHLADFARSQGCGRFQWIVHRENERAIRLYESFGAQAARDWMPMSLTWPRGKDPA